MRSYVTSYDALFDPPRADAPVVERIEIPLIQRDYAQGREGGRSSASETSFLDVLHERRHRRRAREPRLRLRRCRGRHAAAPGRAAAAHDVVPFALVPASRADQLDRRCDGWKQFSYATRPSARLFCERLRSVSPPADVEHLSAWIEDQSWYLYTWRHDPTIQSMLVMLDAMHERFRRRRLPRGMGAARRCRGRRRSRSICCRSNRWALSEDLYIKMNSRGKPLTPLRELQGAIRAGARGIVS